MKNRLQTQLGLLSGLAAKVPGNEFLERLVDWSRSGGSWRELFAATIARRLRWLLVLFKMLLLQHCYGFSGPQGDVTARPQGRPHYGFKAHVAVDEVPALIRHAELSAARKGAFLPPPPSGVVESNPSFNPALWKNGRSSEASSNQIDLRDSEFSHFNSSASAPARAPVESAP